MMNKTIDTNNAIKGGIIRRMVATPNILVFYIIYNLKILCMYY